MNVSREPVRAREELQGTGAARGTASGNARVIYPLHFDAEPEFVEGRDVDAEVGRLSQAFERVRGELERLRKRLQGAFKREVAEFIEAHALILEDPEFRDGIVDHIRHSKIRATSALKMHRDHLIQAFEQIDDPYLRSRREDLDQVVARVFAALKRGESGVHGKVEAIGRGSILVCESIGPAELDFWHEHGVGGIITTQGSVYSHSAILARSYKLPMVIGCAEALARIHDGDAVLMSGDTGQVLLRPDSIDQKRHAERTRESARAAGRRTHLRGADTRTRDGGVLHLWANAEQPSDIHAARRLGVEGIGLYRSEFLFLRQAAPPDEEHQFRAYRDAVHAMAGRPVTLRTLDAGADKPGAGSLGVGHEANPALGLRGLRLTLARHDHFVAQLRAMLRASAHGPVRILLPMVTTIDEVRRTRALIAQCRADLESAGVPIADHVDLGAMIEVPAAALTSAELARECDFLALGSNDLVQYTLAADRNNAAVSGLYDPLHPAVLRLLATCVDNARRARKPLTLCGELAGDPLHLPMLLALGFTELSMHPNALLEIRERAAQLSRKSLRGRRRKLLAARSRDEARALFSDLD